MTDYEVNMIKEYENILSYLEKQRDKKINKMKNLDVLYKINQTQYSDDINNIQVELYYTDGAIEIVKRTLNNFRDKINIEERELSVSRPVIKPMRGFSGEITTEEITINPYLQDTLRVYGEPMLSAEPGTAITSQNITEIINQGIRRLEDS